ncbi:DNA-binding transcriptional LysR family regulator [Rhizobium sp. BK529]|uniref:LysR family transcriptional regulator n=1 Tax=unclassified Rhizobium TaxID=2613769 RepID=UPI001044194E|nr:MULTISPECIES: LysR family transcriptional regulator [unclassified Rhizobium]MBB3590615.1 DNA-binding transcriptional LysR family regulator [Rhizobium sp. BK529]TCS05308.1 LysR family transcriptional regulator [Rhizobium sp. BK418]
MKNLDLNLLLVFDAVMRERNVLRAGQAIALSPSAVSHALARLRALLNDELFVRTAAGMVPTARAAEMAPLVRDALVAAERAIGPPEFKPETSTRQFCIAATDYMTAVVVPHFLRTLSSLAPHAGVTILPATRIDLTAQIDVGRVDVALGSFLDIPYRLRAQLLFEERDVLVVAPDHPLAGRPIAAEELAALPLFAVAAGGIEDGQISERGLTRRMEMFDRAMLVAELAKIGATPNLRVIQPHFLALPALLAGTSAAAIAPARLADLFRRSGTVAVSELPWSAPPTPVQMVWHNRLGHEPGHVWLRAQLEDAARAVSTF